MFYFKFKACGERVAVGGFYFEKRLLHLYQRFGNMKKSKEIQPFALPLDRQIDRNAFALWLGLSFRD